MINALTIDVEDYFQVSNFEAVVKYDHWDRYESRVVGNTDKILDILGERNVKATFFVLGWVAERFPELVQRIYLQGHEVASHGYSHRLVYEQGPKGFWQDVKKAKKILEQIIPEPILGYRATNYSITQRSLWALDILTEEGFKYDSSIFPIYHERGGIPGAKRYPHRIQNSNGGILEFPLSTARLLGQNIPLSGGGYFRLFPYRFIRWGIKKINNERYPVVFYVHPWELDPQQPRIKVNVLDKFRHYVNLNKTEDKLKRLLSDFKFAPIKEVLGLR